MIVKTKAFVLRTVNYSDTSIIATLFTEELGLQSYLLRGARSSKKGKGNLFQPMQFLDLVVQHRENKNLQYVREHKADLVYKSILYDIRKSAIGLFLLEVINACVQEETANPELFQFVQESFVLLDEQQQDFQNFHLHFLQQLAAQLGFQPYNNYSSTNNLFALEDGFFVSADDLYPNALSSKESAMFAQFLDESQPKISKHQRRELLHLWERYYQYHIINFKAFKTPLIFEEVFG